MKSAPVVSTADEVDEIVRRIQYNRLKIRPIFSTYSNSLHSKLYDAYVKACEIKSRKLLKKELLPSVYLANKLIDQEGSASIIISLFHSDKGYSVALRGDNKLELQPVFFSYEEDELLRYLDSLEIPPVLLSILDNNKLPVFDNGCVVVEVRDYRCKPESAKNFDRNYLILHPTAETLINDINTMTKTGNWTQDDKLRLESEILLATQNPLCLDSSINVLRVCNKLQYNRIKYNNWKIKRLVKRNVSGTGNRSLLLDRMTTRNQLCLVDFLCESHKKRSNIKFDLKIAKPVVDTWKQQKILLNLPSNLEVEKYAKKKDAIKFSPDYSLEVVQNILFQGETNESRNSQSRLIIMKRPVDDSYVGELFIESLSSKEAGNKLNTSCRFELGGIESAKRYLEQFKELVTEEGRNPVKIASSKSTDQSTNSERSQTDELSQGRLSVLNKNSTVSGCNTMYRQVTNIPASSPSPVVISQSQLRCQTLPSKQFIQYGVRPNMTLITSPPSSPGVQNSSVQLQHFRVPPTDMKTTGVNTPAVNVASNTFGRQYIISQQGTPISPVSPATGSVATGNLANTTIVSTIQLAPIAPAVNVNSPSNIEARKMVQNKLLLRNQYQQQQHVNMPIRGIAPVQRNQQQLAVSVLPPSNSQSRPAVITRHQSISAHSRGSSIVPMSHGNNSNVTTGSMTATTTSVTFNKNYNSGNIGNTNINNSNSNNNNINNKSNTGTSTANININNNNNNSSKNYRNESNSDNSMLKTASSSASHMLQLRPNVGNSLNLQQGQILIQKYQHKRPQNLPAQAINQSQQHLQQLKPREQQSCQSPKQLEEPHMRSLGIRRTQRSLQQQKQQQQTPPQQQIQLQYHQQQP